MLNGATSSRIRMHLSQTRDSCFACPAEPCSGGVFFIELCHREFLYGQVQTLHRQPRLSCGFRLIKKKKNTWHVCPYRRPQQASSALFPSQIIQVSMHQHTDINRPWMVQTWIHIQTWDNRNNEQLLKKAHQFREQEKKVVNLTGL